MREAVQVPPLRDTVRLALHTRTLQPLDLRQCAALCASRGLRGLSLWRDVVHAAGLADAARIVRDAGLTVPALVRGGFFVHAEAAARARAFDDNRACLDEAQVLGAESLCLVPGSAGDVPLARGRELVRDEIERLLPYAEAARVRLAIEPLHPMYAADKSCINRMQDAGDLCDAVNHPLLGIAVDVYHVWWDPDLEREIARAGRRGRLFALHLCDWRVPTRDLLLDRELMGRGCIALRSIRGMMEASGFAGWHEVEIFSRDYWAMDQGDFLGLIRRAYLEHC